MTAKQLLLPRFEVIADYPNSIYNIGDVLELKEITNSKIFHNNENFLVGNFFNQEELEKYPHLFKKLQWYEKRKEEEMPKKVIFNENPLEEYLIEKWDMIHLFGYIDIKQRSGCDLTIFNTGYGYLPVD